MILFLTLIYIGILLLLIKFNVVKPTLWWKLSPIAWSLFLLIVLIIPLQFWAPSGPLISVNYSVAIVPRVAGEVTAVHAEPNKQMKKGEILFELDPLPYQAAFDDATAALQLAEIRIRQEERLVKQQAGRQLDLDRARAQLKQMQARYNKVKYDLDATKVRAPGNGYATNITLRPGARVAALPLTPAMSFILSDEKIVGALVLQNHLRFIESGQQAEIAFKIYPGRVFAASVEYVVQARATGLEPVSGAPVVPQEIVHAPFGVRLKLGEEAAALNLPSGITGRMVIYSENGSFAHVIRKVEIRIEAILNYINPF